MNSATSIEEMRAKAATASAGPDAGGAARDPSAVPGFRPWHFFLLASLIAATAAVLMSGQSSPAHLVLISLTVVAAGVAAAGFYRMLAPLVADETHAGVEALSSRARAALEREKALTLRSIKELEFDRAMGKVSAGDFDEMAGRLRSRAMALIRQLEEGPAPYRELIERELSARLAGRHESAGVPPAPDAPPVCSDCGTINDTDAAFCKRCGFKLAPMQGGAA